MVRLALVPQVVPVPEEIRVALVPHRVVDLCSHPELPLLSAVITEGLLTAYLRSERAPACGAVPASNVVVVSLMLMDSTVLSTASYGYLVRASWYDAVP